MPQYAGSMQVKIIQIAKRIEKRGCMPCRKMNFSIWARKCVRLYSQPKKGSAGSTNRALQQIERLNLGQKMYQAIFFGQTQSKRYRLGRCASLAEALRTLKSLKSDPNKVCQKCGVFSKKNTCIVRKKFDSACFDMCNSSHMYSVMIHDRQIFCGTREQKQRLFYSGNSLSKILL